MTRPRQGARARSASTKTGICSRYGAGADGQAVKDPNDNENVLHVVFVQPQIHWNTGNIGRTCLGLGASLHLVGPLGFSLSEKQIRRAGLDYWQHVDVNVYENWEEFADGRLRQLDGSRFFFTKFGSECAAEVEWPHDGKIVLIFGSEINGFDGIEQWMKGRGASERRVAFPMVDDRFRSFNLSTTASMVRSTRRKRHTLTCRVAYTNPRNFNQKFPCARPCGMRTRPS